MKIANWVVAVLFVLAAVVQFNDVDAAIWIVIYLAAGIFAGLAAMDRFPQKVASFFAVGCFFFFLYLCIREINTGRIAWHDGMFEVLGILLVAVWMNLNVLFKSAKLKSAEK